MKTREHLRITFSLFFVLITCSVVAQLAVINKISPNPVPEPLIPGETYNFIFQYDDITNVNENVDGTPTLVFLSGSGTANIGTISGSFFNFQITPDPGANISFRVNAQNNSSNVGEYNSGIITLPVEMSKFDITHRGNKLILEWTTISEQNNDYFTIERSFSGSKFEEITKIPGAGNSHQEIQYSFEDIEVINLEEHREVYYRLMQTDFDGNSSYSEIVNIQLDEKAGLEIINIVQDGELLDLNFYSPENANIAVEIYDLKGLKVVSQEFLPFEEFNEIQLSTNGLPEGFYVISLNNGENRVTKKFLKF